MLRRLGIGAVLVLLCSSPALAIGPIEGRCIALQADLSAKQPIIDTYQVTAVTGDSGTVQKWRNNLTVGQPLTMTIGEILSAQQVQCPKRGADGKWIERSYEKRLKADAAAPK